VVAGRELVQGAEAFDFGGVCGDDPPVGRPGVLPAGDSAAFEPPEQGRHRHLDLAGQGGQPPLPGSEAAVIGAVVVRPARIGFIVRPRRRPCAVAAAPLATTSTASPGLRAAQTGDAKKRAQTGDAKKW
jgi:hypothetical protein